VEPQGLLTPSHRNTPKPHGTTPLEWWLVACCDVSIVFRLAFVTVALAACATPSLSTYDDKDPPIENGGSGEGSCSPTAFVVTPVKPYIQIMVDGSGTMSQGLGGGDSKYQSVRDSLTTATTGVLNPLESKALFGVSIYTSQNACPKLYTQPCVADNTAAIRTEFGQTNPQTGTDPLPEAIDTMVTNFASAPAGAKKYIVLATDGVPNSCTSNTGDRTDDAVTATTAAYTAGISTYIIGLGSVPTSFLQPMADAGVNGTGTAYPSPDVATLTTNYTTVFNAIMDCEMTLDGTIDVAQASLGTVRVNGTTLVYSTDWTAVDEHTIKLLGTTCATYNSTLPAQEITATFTCGSSH
jgi:hypothetical protein